MRTTSTKQSFKLIHNYVFTFFPFYFLHMRVSANLSALLVNVWFTMTSTLCSKVKWDVRVIHILCNFPKSFDIEIKRC